MFARIGGIHGRVKYSMFRERSVKFGVEDSIMLRVKV
jgi:hypothetical protein